MGRYGARLGTTSTATFDQIMNLDVGPGRFWFHQPLIRPDIEVTVTAQLRMTGDMETITVVTVDDRASTELRQIVSDLPAEVAPLRTSLPSRYGEGVWRRVPGPLKRPVRAVWHRQLHDQQPAELVVDLPTLDVLQRAFVPPTDLPREDRVDGWGMTSGLLPTSRVTVLRLSVPEPVEPVLGPAFRISSAAADLLGVLYLNGPPGWLDAVAVLSTDHDAASPEALSIEVVPA